jgi:hypothetical protein
MSSSRVSLYASNGCGGGSCPTVYKTEDGKFYVQGYSVEQPAQIGVTLPSGESLVQVDEALIRAIKAAG